MKKAQTFYNEMAARLLIVLINKKRIELPARSSWRKHPLFKKAFENVSKIQKDRFFKLMNEYTEGGFTDKIHPELAQRAYIVVWRYYAGLFIEGVYGVSGSDLERSFAVMSEQLAGYKASDKRIFHGNIMKKATKEVINLYTFKVK